LWTVRDPNDGPNNFPTIQAAIISPKVANGDTIHVFAGADGPIIVTKTLRIIGQGIAVTTINGGRANAVTIRADNVFITEFTITGGNAGILCATWNGLTISNNDISGNRVGIVLFKSTKDTILGNSITTNLCGILLWGSTSVMVRANDISGNAFVGIQLIPPVTGNIYYNNFVNNNGLHVWPFGCAAPGIAIVWDDNGVYGAFKGNYWVQPPVPCPGDRGPLPGPWVRMKQDVNLDGTVNIIDISTAAAAFGTKWSDPRWNPKADVDGNGKIDILDIAKIAQKWGWKDP
jgi:parallel beta-helix repeat protein